ncbi:MAG: glycerol-3-phosphate transporter, partial [Muribaculum sp.]|nr:glycerol-3-phosphate transporter [Muribaculum sp.]
AGTAAGLTGFFGYFFGTAILANIVVGYVAQTAGWNWTFIMLIGACILSMVFMGLTIKEEQYLVEQK